ncbi:MAG: ThiF family adenylyltransferase [Planctomycetaceae bacterium]
MSDVIHISEEPEPEDRFSRFRLIGWWDQDRLRRAKVLVIGAGALGNELIKNLALLGVGNVLVADLDRIENSNLSRSVLYRAEDCGKSKAQTAAERARHIFPEMNTQSFDGNIVFDLGLGVYRWADVILGGLDNREARVAINQAAARTGKVWIDGAIERLSGVARVFDPISGPCYECTMSEIDWKMLEARRSCALLTRDEMQEGKVPTTPTTSSVVAGVQAQEAVKYLHGLDVIKGQGFVFDGEYHNSYTVTYQQSEDCPTHEAYEPIVELPWKVSETTVGQLLERIQQDLGKPGVIEFNHDLLSALTCPECNVSEPMLASLGKVKVSQGACPQCGGNRTPEMYHTLDASTPLVDKTLGELGIPLWDIIGGRAGMDMVYYEFTGDREEVLGPLAAAESSEN